MENEQQDINYEKIIEKLALKIANLEISLANEQVGKEYYIEEYHKLKAQAEQEEKVENNDD